MAAQPVKVLPEGPEWLYELKLDGYRALLLKDGTDVRLLSRNERDLTRTYADLAAKGERLSAKEAVLDGEIVALDEAGRPSFQALQHASQARRIVYYAFDLLHLNGVDLVDMPLAERRAKLPKVLEGSGILLSQELPGTAAQVIEAVRGLKLEGVIAKRRDSKYESGERSGEWVKLKLELQQEFVIGGYRPTGNTIDAVLVGYYEGTRLRFAAKVRSGFVPRVRRELYTSLATLRVVDCPFSDLPSGKSRWGGGVTAEEMSEMRWVKPQLVAQVRFVEWTADGHLRHAIYLGLRADKGAKAVRRESPEPPSSP
jgi:bifunctional non-homologous end joining protein LigD